MTLTREVNLTLPEYAMMFDVPGDIYCLSGGRGAAKSWTIGQIVMDWALALDAQGIQWQIACVREYMSSLDESVKPLLEATMLRMEIADLFKYKQGKMGPGIYPVGREYGRIFFGGMSTVSEESIKGWEGVRLVWFDESHRLSIRSWELLAPTIRAEDSAIILTYNPESRHDVPYLEFCGENPRRTDGVVVRHVTYRDNPWFTARNERERQHCLQVMPERYAHIWEGEPDDAGEEFRLLPYATLTAIASADTWALRPREVAGRPDLGYDVADQGDDANAKVLRLGPCITDFGLRRKARISRVVDWVHGTCVEQEVATMYYDVTGVGTGVKTAYDERYPEMESGGAGPPYEVAPELFGGAVKRPNQRVVMGIRNKNFFENRAAQMAWELKVRAQNTMRLRDGEKVDPMSCLFIDPGLAGLDQFLHQLSQPVYETQRTGKVRVIKAKANEPSPDYFDAACLAFAGETRGMGWRPV